MIISYKFFVGIINCVGEFVKCCINLFKFYFLSNKSCKLQGNISTECKPIIPRSVNYHFTRKCNYQCGFCFHTALTSHVLPLEEAKHGLQMLATAGMEKINFSGGEPFIHDQGEYLGKLVQFCKEDLMLPSVSIVSNGSLIRESWFEDFGEFLDILAISCDSFDESTNKAIGRGQGSRNHVAKLRQIRDWCDQYRVAFKINTVVNTFNVDEDMAENIVGLNPVRWKVFQCLLLEGENAGPNALRNAERFYISDLQFQAFLERHSHVPCLVPESNVKMQNSYLILDEYMRFLDCREGAKKPSPSLLDVGVAFALDQSGFDEKMFRKRGGIYTWSKKDLLLDCVMKRIVQEWFIDPCSFSDLGFTSDVKLELLLKSVTFGPTDEIYYFNLESLYANP